MARLTVAGRIILPFIFLAAIFAAARGQTPRRAEDLFNRAQQRLKENDIEGAIADLTIVIELTSSLQSGKFRARDSPNGAWGIVDTPGTKGVRVVDPRTAVAFNARGMAKFVKRDYDGAIADFDSALRISPGFAEAHFWCGIVWEAKGDFERALADYDRAIKLNPQLAEAHNRRGGAHYSRGAVEAAIYDFSRAIELSPRFAEAYSNRGLSRQSKGDWPNAIADFDRALEINPRNAAFYFNRGAARQAQGDLKAAIADYDQIGRA